jgi:predicted esterase
MRFVRPALLLLVAFAPLAIGAPRLLAKDDLEPTRRVWNERDQAKDVTAWIKEYATAAPQRRSAIHGELDALGLLRLRSVKKHAKSLLKSLRKRGAQLTKKASQSFKAAGLEGRIHIQGAKKRKPLLIALHGGGQGVGDGKNALQKWGLASGRCIVIAPTTPDKVSAAWNRADIEQWVLALIDAAKRTWDVDTNRIYVAGHSMGGYGTWSIGTRHADRFAALSACAGGVFMMGSSVAPGHLPNLLNTPIWFYNSTDDKQVSSRSAHAADELLKGLKAKSYPYVWTYNEYDNIGHGLPPKGLKPIVDWMLQRKRDPNPTWLVWEPSRTHKRRFAWLGRPTGSARIEGKIDKNIITLTGASGKTTVYLNPDLVDLKNPITIRRETKTLFEGMVYPRLSVLLQTITEDEDPRRWYCAAVEVE